MTSTFGRTVAGVAAAVVGDVARSVVGAVVSEMGVTGVAAEGETGAGAVGLAAGREGAAGADLTGVGEVADFFFASSIIWARMASFAVVRFSAGSSAEKTSVAR